MIDVHFHCLPLVDDGPRSWEDAVALCREAADQGTEAIVATPHVLRDPWINADPAARDAAILKLNDLLGGDPPILPGAEVYFTSELPDMIEGGPDGPPTTINRGPYVLVEFPALSVPREAELVIHELSLIGIVPVIAHPERNLALAEEPARLAALVRRGARAQLTAGSLLGDFGPAALYAAVEFQRLGLVHLVASDAHSLERRPPRLYAARQWIRREWGDDVERALCTEGPADLLEARREDRGRATARRP